MNLPSPVQKEAYNNHWKQFEKEVILEAEVKMNQAASRLKDIIKAEDPVIVGEMSLRTYCLEQKLKGFV